MFTWSRQVVRGISLVKNVFIGHVVPDPCESSSNRVKFISSPSAAACSKALPLNRCSGAGHDRQLSQKGPRLVLSHSQGDWTVPEQTDPTLVCPAAVVLLAAVVGSGLLADSFQDFHECVQGMNTGLSPDAHGTMLIGFLQAHIIGHSTARISSWSSVVLQPITP